MGREAPLDHDLCKHFLESLTMQQLVDEGMQNEKLVASKRADAIKQKILENAKIIVSTLNYSANNTLLSIKNKKSVKFVIVDEGKVFSCSYFCTISAIIIQLVKV